MALPPSVPPSMCKASKCVVKEGRGRGPFLFPSGGDLAAALPPLPLLAKIDPPTGQEEEDRTKLSPPLIFPSQQIPQSCFLPLGRGRGTRSPTGEGQAQKGKKERLLLLSRGERAEAAAPLLPLVLFLAPSLPPTHSPSPFLLVYICCFFGFLLLPTQSSLLEMGKELRGRREGGLRKADGMDIKPATGGICGTLPRTRKHQQPSFPYQVMSPLLVTIWLSSRNLQQLRYPVCPGSSRLTRTLPSRVLRL